MASKGGFKGNRAVIGRILTDDPGVRAAVDSIAEDAQRRAGGDAEVLTYTTDRYVAALSVGADEQATDGAGTKSMAGAAGGFVSKAQWRRAFAEEIDGASEVARNTEGGYGGLPERKSSS